MFLDLRSSDLSYKGRLPESGLLTPNLTRGFQPAGQAGAHTSVPYRYIGQPAHRAKAHDPKADARRRLTRLSGNGIPRLLALLQARTRSNMYSSNPSRSAKP